ncbi:MAG: adenosine deaminase [Propionibacteriaceae bacterium]|jgi:adenosine deaminase|nr:adenosine deaminase [Propionibacteriaceae bacterium]
MELVRVPKAELHLHVEGTLEPEMVFELARRNAVPLPWDSVAELRGRYQFTSLQSFLDLYYQCMTVLRTQEDFAQLAWAYYQRAAADGVAHAELFFDPQVHVRNGVPLAEVIAGLTEAASRAALELGITGGLIMCFLRDLGADAAAELLAAAEPYLGQLLGVGLDSAEVGHPPSEFIAVFARARELGLHVVAHAGEEGEPDYVWQALDLLHAERIDHGIRSVEDGTLLAALAARQIPLTLCPLSNVRLQAVDTLAAHPLPALLDAGVLVSVNSDDPAYFGGYLGANFAAVTAEFGLDDAQLLQLCRNSVTASFATAERKTELLALINEEAT